MSLSTLVSSFTSRGVSVKTIGDAVVGGRNWLLRQSYAPQVLSAWTNLSFSVGGIPNFGQSGGSVTVSKNAGDQRVYLTTPGQSNLHVTLEGLVAAASNAKFSAPVDTQAQAEAEAAAAEAARLEAAAAAAKAKAAEAAAKVSAAKANTKSADSLLSSFLSAFSR